MSQTTAKANADVADAIQATAPTNRRRSMVVWAIALGSVTVAAILSVVVITSNNTNSTTPPQPAGQQQPAPAGGELSRGANSNTDDCARPNVTERMSCR